VQNAYLENVAINFNIMRSFKIFFTLTFLITAFIACSQNNNDINFENPFENEIGFINSDTEEFQSITKEQLVNYWKDTFEIESNKSFEDFEIRELRDVETGDKYYTLQTISESGEISITNEVSFNENRILMNKKTCKCESQSCNFSGCDASLFPGGSGRCQCSTCSGDCKKTSTVVSDFTAVFSQY